jgi:hypothetical protein
MDAEQAIMTIRNIHSRINKNLFDKIFDSYSQTVINLYYQYNHNTIEVIRNLSRENQIKLWKWLNSIGVDNLTKLKEAYCIISYIYKKLDDEDLPKSISSMLNRYDCENMVCFIVALFEDSLNELVTWCKEWLIDLELDKAKTGFILFYNNQNLSIQNVQYVNLSRNSRINVRPSLNAFSGNNEIRYGGSGETMRTSITPRHISLKYPLALPIAKIKQSI